MILGRHTSDLVSELQAVKSLDGLGSAISSVAKSIGFDGYTFVHLDPNTGVTSLEQRPKAWMERYNRNGYAPMDPVIIEAYDFGIRDG